MTCSPDEETDRQTDRQIDMLIKKSTQNRVFFTHAQVHSGQIDSNQILHINPLGGRSNIFGWGVSEGWGVRKWASPIDFSIGF